MSKADEVIDAIRRIPGKETTPRQCHLTPTTMKRRDVRSENKARGRDAAKAWCKTASIKQQVELAAADLEYGETLNALRADEFDVPESSDWDYSWGFFKQVKWKIFRAIHRGRP